MKLGELLKALMTKAGVNVTDLATKSADFAGLLTLAAEMPDDVASQLETALLTLESAKNNPTIKSHYFAQALDGIDGVLEKIAKKRQLPDDVWNTLKGEKSTPKRLELLEDKLLELRDAKDNSTSKTEKGQLQQQIDALQNELRQTKEAHNAALDAERKGFTAKETSLMVDALLARRNFANKDVPVDVNILTAKALIDKELAKEGVMMVNKDGVIRILKQDGSDYYNQKHEKVDATSFFDGVLSSNKMLTVTDPAKQDDNNNPGKKTVVDDPSKKVNGTLLAANSNALSALSQAGYM